MNRVTLKTKWLECHLVTKCRKMSQNSTQMCHVKILPPHIPFHDPIECHVNPKHWAVLIIKWFKTPKTTHWMKHGDERCSCDKMLIFNLHTFTLTHSHRWQARNWIPIGVHAFRWIYVVATKSTEMWCRLAQHSCERIEWCELWEKAQIIISCHNNDNRRRSWFSRNDVPSIVSIHTSVWRAHRIRAAATARDASCNITNDIYD